MTPERSSLTEAQQVRAAAEARAAALARRDAAALSAVLHPDFVWTSHRGETFDRDPYVIANSGSSSRWLRQSLDDVRVVFAGSTAVLMAVVTDEVVNGEGGVEVFRMPVTQTWVHEGGRWLCLAGHAGPRL